MASVGDVGESSHDHDRDDHGATEEGNVRMTVHERHAQESADLYRLNSGPGDDEAQRGRGNLQGSRIARMDYKDFCLTCLVTLAAINTVINLRSQRRR